MSIRAYLSAAARRTEIGTRLLEDARYRAIAGAVCSLIFNLCFALYFGIFGLLSGASIFTLGGFYYLWLTVMRFSVLLQRKSAAAGGRGVSITVGVMLIMLSLLVVGSMVHQSPSVHGTIPMIAIATFTFTKITVAVINAVKAGRTRPPLARALSFIRYAEISVSLLTMQRSMLVTFGEGNDASSIALNAFTGAAVFSFILALGFIACRSAAKKGSTEK